MIIIATMDIDPKSGDGVSMNGDRINGDCDTDKMKPRKMAYTNPKRKPNTRLMKKAIFVNDQIPMDFSSYFTIYPAVGDTRPIQARFNISRPIDIQAPIDTT